MTDFKFNASEVKCNGVGGAGYQGALKHFDAIKLIVDEVVNTIGRDELYTLAVASGEKYDDFYAGRRFNSNDDLAYRLVSGLARYASTKLEDDLLVEMYIGAQLKMLSYEDKQTMVVDAARDCASADHWYTFEKDWG